ncbi:L,D-transpeptidase [Companilactobacillus furfuricola]|uniref:L,D-transpeptidase n=1 Tax=Companilactobacillus furfuricola TaxID=1462575 RepID=UPI0013DD91ED|nr:L,D-transpeptidase [Companilactobacillus furfuricola]
MKAKKLYPIILLSLLLGVSVGFNIAHIVEGGHPKVERVEADSSKSTVKQVNKSKTAATNGDDPKMVPLDEFTYKDSSETKAYPILKDHPEAYIDVDIAKQRTYIKDGNKTLYEMYASTGEKDATPRGTYQIEPEHGEYFYTAPLKLGAYHWVSFLNHGEYLFHSTPTDENGNYVESIAKTLGVKPSSHGCVHLSNPDLQWLYNNVQPGMKVVIHGTFDKTK